MRFERTFLFINCITLLLALGIIVEVAGQEPCATPSFNTAPQRPYEDNTLKSLTYGDFNNDNKLDIAIARFRNSSSFFEIHIRLNNGNGTFNIPTGSPISVSGFNPTTIKSGKFDSGNNQDLVIVHTTNGSDRVTVLLGNGTGQFTPVANPTDVGDNAQTLALDDFNGDTFLDVATVNRHPNPNAGVRILFGQGNGSFNTPIFFNTGISYSGYIAAERLDNDNDIDLIVVSGDSTNKARAFFNNGNGVFSPSNQIIDMGNDAQAVAVGDFNNDGNIDFVTPNTDSDDVSIRLGSSNGNFTTPNPSEFQVGNNPSDIAVGDFNNDGNLDVATANFSSSSVSILLGQGNGQFSQNFDRSSGNSFLIAAANFSGNRSVDLLVGVNANPDYLTLLTNNCIPSNRAFDFDGDNKTDIGIFRPALGEWWYLRSIDNVAKAFQFGQSSDKIVPTDFTGDGETDIAFWRPSTSQWYVLRSEDNSFYAFNFGANGDIPIPADFDGDGKADPAIFRPSNATWFILKSGGGTKIQQFGLTGDAPIAQDFDGDGKADLAVFRPSESQWFYQRSTDLVVKGFQFGASGDKAVPTDFTGDGKADIAFWRPSSGEWFILRSEDNSFYAFPFGTNGDIPTPGDYDSDGKADAAVFRPSSNIWYLQQSTAGFKAIQFGIANDIPIPSAYIP